MSKLRMAFILLVCAIPLMGCETDEGPTERMGERVDEAAENTREGAEDAAENVEDRYEDATN